MSSDNVKRYIRLTNLIPELLNMVDEKKIAFNPAVELSYLKQEEQRDFLEAMDYAQATPSLSQAQRLKKFSQDGKCSLDAMCAIMSEEKKGELDRVTLKNDVLRKYFPKSYTPKQKIGVAAAEQLYKGQGRGEEKKKYVLEFLASMGFTVDEEAINAAIEAAVNQLNGGNLPLE